MSQIKTMTIEETSSGVFASTLSAMHNGKVLADLDDALRECTRQVGSTQKKGRVTLHLTIVPNGVGQGDTPLYKVEDDIKVTLPKKSRQPSVFFADDDSNLTRRNPKQEEISFKSVQGGSDKDAPTPGQSQIVTKTA